MPIVTQSSGVLNDPNVAMASSDFYSNPQLATATLRRVAAGYVVLSDGSHLSDLVVHGTEEEYRNLTPDQQVALTDQMAYLIAMYPNSFPQNIAQEAERRVANPNFGTPLADTSFDGNLVEQLANGQFVDNALAGAKDYLNHVAAGAGAGIVTYVLGGLALYFVMEQLGMHHSQSNKETRA